MSEDKTRFYFGRYSLDVPTDGADIWSSYKVVNTKITLVSRDGKRDLPGMIDSQIAKINDRHRFGSTAYDQTVPLDRGGAIVVSKSNYYTFDIYYLTAGNTLHYQHVEALSIRGFDQALARAKEINSLIHSRNPADSPPKGTFAIEAAYIADDIQSRVSIGLPVSSVPGIHLNFDTRRVGEAEPGLLSRVDQRSWGALGKILSGSSTLRRGTREVAGLPFEELLLKTRADGRSVYAFRLEYPGTPESSLAPYTALELSTLDKGKSFDSDEDALRFWDEMVGSVKRF